MRTFTIGDKQQSNAKIINTHEEIFALQVIQQYSLYVMSNAWHELNSEKGTQNVQIFIEISSLKTEIPSLLKKVT